MKTISLLKAVLTEDMSLFRYKSKSNSKLAKAALPLFLFSTVAFCIGIYAYQIGKILAPHDSTCVVLSLFLAITAILTYIEGMYKSATIIFDSKDSDLLFSLPIKKTTILFVRIFKLIIFQYIFNMMYLLPAFVVYCYFERPSFSFYPISILMVLLLPLIPTVIACLVSYIFRLLFSKFKKNKVVQAVFSIIFFLFVFYFSSNRKGITEHIVPVLMNIHDKIINYYYPIKLYIGLITKPQIVNVLKLIVVNVLPFGLFILLASVYYFKFISKASNVKVTHKKVQKEVKIKTRKPIVSLAIKDLKRYLSSSVYMMNTLFGMALLLALTITLCVKGKNGMLDILSNYEISKNISVTVLFYFLILVSGCFTSITSSSVSLEGKTINMTKSLPVDIKDILKSKILCCYIIELPFMILSIFLYTVFFKPSLIDFIILLVLSLLVIFLTAVIGLIFNLKYPKLNFTSDVEVVKQSLSVMLSLFLGMFIMIFSIVLVAVWGSIFKTTSALIVNILMIGILTMILYLVLMHKGTKKYQELNI